ncbi:MAG: ROK family protein [Zavarzinella sp.]
MAEQFWIGVDLGGTKILTGLFDSQLNLVQRKKTATNASEGGPAVVARVVETVHAVLAEHQLTTDQVAGLGLSVPGQVVLNTKVVRFAPNLNWRDFDLAPLLPTTWQFPTVVQNDVRMGTYGEWKKGAAIGAQHVFGIFPGTGVGGALILNGDLFHGFHGHAGEIGHIVLQWRKGQTLEDIAGRKNIVKHAKAMLADMPRKVRKTWKDVDTEKLKSSQIAKMYQNSDPIMLQAIDEAAKALGAAIGSVVNLVSPEIIVIGGGLAEALGEPFREHVWEIAERYILPDAALNVPCVLAKLGDDAGITGAAAYVQDHLASLTQGATE